MDGWMYRRMYMHGCIRTDGWMHIEGYKYMNGWMEGWRYMAVCIDGCIQMDGFIWMDGWKDGYGCMYDELMHMNGWWMDVQYMDGCIWMVYGWIDRRMNAWMIEGCIYVWMYYCMFECINGWMEIRLFNSSYLKKNQGGRTLHFPENVSNCNLPNPDTHFFLGAPRIRKVLFSTDTFTSHLHTFGIIWKSDQNLAHSELLTNK